VTVGTFLGLWLLLVALGLPLFVTLGLASLASLWAQGDVLLALPQRVTAAANSFTLLAAPFFMLAGLAMNTSGVTNRIYAFAESLVGWLRGGLAHVNVVGSVIFAGMSAEVTAASATIGPIIPPSVPMLVYAVTADASIGRLFLGGVVPGLLMAAALMLQLAWMSRRRGYPRRPFPRLHVVAARGWAALPSLLTPAILLGGMLAGAFTPTEAGVVAAAYALLLGLVIHRELRLRDLPRLFQETVEANGVILILVMTSSLFAFVLARAQVPQVLAGWLVGLSTNPTVVLLAINVFLLLVGCFLEALAAIVILVPVLLPAVKLLGIDPVHFGVVMVLNLMIGTLTPPVGIVLFVVSRVAQLPFEVVVRSTAPFLVPLVAVLLAITLWPDLVLFLPRLVLGP
jgi:tripartite ATP-independent transporter DctM subunit